MKYCILIIISVSILFGCGQKETINPKKTTTADKTPPLLIGKWQIYKDNTKVYAPNSTNLLKDSTNNFTLFGGFNKINLIFNKDGTGYVTSMPYTKIGSTKTYVDTTSYLTYKIEDNKILMFESDDTEPTDLDTIVNLTKTDLQLETIYDASISSGWGLPLSSTYRFRVNTFYTKQ